jgi:hypothetical protein
MRRRENLTSLGKIKIFEGEKQRKTLNIAKKSIKLMLNFDLNNHEALKKKNEFNFG